MFLDGDAGKEFALIKGHKGFVRRAMAHGVPLVPVYGKNGMRAGQVMAGPVVDHG